jgi:hypothetical protein
MERGVIQVYDLYDLMLAKQMLAAAREGGDSDAISAARHYLREVRDNQDPHPEEYDDDGDLYTPRISPELERVLTQGYLDISSMAIHD